MARTRRLLIVFTMILAAIGAEAETALRLAGAQSPDQIRAVISAPTEGQQLFGLVNILGSAEHSTAFARYTLEYDDLSDPTVTWLLVQPAVQQQVHDGVLGTWNTNVVPDGSYRLRLRVFLQDGQTGEFIVSNLRVVNRAPTPVPTIPASEGESMVPQFTPGPSPTSPIVQPPSNNPGLADFASAQQAPLEPASAPTQTRVIRQSNARINLTRVRQAFCSGFYLAIGAFVLMIGYSLLRRYTHSPRRPASWSERWPDDWGVR
ncbi:MAG: hypothetical protein ACUVSU_00825 [Aggregatilineaceae bacterium]